MEIKRAEQIAKDLMSYHRLENWSFKFSNAVSLFGYCYWSKRVISLSKHLVEMNPEEEVINTILHEIAHALAPKFAHHGPEWKDIAVRIGCTGSRCYDSAKVVRPPKKYMGACPNGHVQYAHRRRNVSCAKCCPTFNRSYLIAWGKIS